MYDEKWMNTTKVAQTVLKNAAQPSTTVGFRAVIRDYYDAKIHYDVFHDESSDKTIELDANDVARIETIDGVNHVVIRTVMTDVQIRMTLAFIIACLFASDDEIPVPIHHVITYDDLVPDEDVYVSDQCARMTMDIAFALILGEDADGPIDSGNIDTLAYEHRFGRTPLKLYANARHAFELQKSTE